jgi:hypothetical protein
MFETVYAKKPAPNTAAAARAVDTASIMTINSDVKLRDSRMGLDTAKPNIQTQKTRAVMKIKINIVVTPDHFVFILDSILEK